MNFMLSKNLTVLTITITKAKNEAEIVQDTSRITPRLMAEIQPIKVDYTGSESTCVEALLILK
jgi:hypothetical protein